MSKVTQSGVVFASCTVLGSERVVRLHLQIRIYDS